MATYTEQNVPAVSKRFKVIATDITFSGLEMDKGAGSISAGTTGRLVDAEDEPILDGNGECQYSGAGAITLEEISVTDVLATEIDGITGEQIMGWLGKWFDNRLL